MTLATDYLLAAISTFLGFSLLKHSRWWAVAFFLVALAALAGGTTHGFPGVYPLLLWKTTLTAAGMASFAMVVGTSRGTGLLQGLLFWFASLKLLAYGIWTTLRDDFIAVVIDSGVALLVVALLHAVRGDAAWRWMVSGVAVSVVAAGVQAMKLAPHPHFNHNDLYHVVQIAAMWLFYRGVRLY
jgi:hypothetical protein